MHPARGSACVGVMLSTLSTGDSLEGFIHSWIAPLTWRRREDLRRVTLSTLGMEDIFEAEGLGPLGEEEVEQEMSEAAEQFKAAGEEYDEGRLREQVTEVLKVWPMHFSGPLAD